MDMVEKVLEERAEELADEVRSEVGLTAAEARRLVEQAKPDLVASFRWKATGGGSSSPRFRSPPGRAYLVHDLLDAMSGRAVAEKVGIPANRGWEALRALVPAVLDRVANAAGEVRTAETADEDRMAESAGEDRGADSDRRQQSDRAAGEARGSGEGQAEAGGSGAGEGLAVGFGLFVEGLEASGTWRSGRGGVFGHPVFDYLPPGRDRPLS